MKIVAIVCALALVPGCVSPPPVIDAIPDFLAEYTRSPRVPPEVPPAPQSPYYVVPDPLAPIGPPIPVATAKAPKPKPKQYAALRPMPNPIADPQNTIGGGTISGVRIGGSAEGTVAGFPAAYTTTCVEDATDGQDDTPSTIAWVADDGGTTNTGSFDDPYDYNEQLLGVTTSDNANKVDLWGDGVRTVCWKKVTSNYTLIHGGTASLAWNQGPLLNTTPTQGLVNFAYPAAPLHTGSDAAFETTTLFAGVDRLGAQTIDSNNVNARAFGEWYGFRIGEIDTTERSGIRAWPFNDNPVPDLTIKIEWNYLASSFESDYNGGNSGNDSTVAIGTSDGATVKYNYFADPLMAGTRSSSAWAGYRSYYGVNTVVSNNTFNICNGEGSGWDFAYPKRDTHNFTFTKNIMYARDDSASCNAIGGVFSEGSHAGLNDADVGLYERNLYWYQETTQDDVAYQFSTSSDEQIGRYNLLYGAHTGFTNGSLETESCDGTNTDEYQNTDNDFYANVFIDVHDRLYVWYTHINNRPISLDDNAIWFEDETLGHYVHEGYRVGGGYTDCGGATEAFINANNPTGSAGIANFNGLSYASGNSDADPRMVCQYTGDNKCNGGTVAAPDDIRFCTGVNTPVSGCPGASPFVDGSGIADRGPYQGENMNNDPSTYTVQIGAGWLPPASHR